VGAAGTQKLTVIRRTGVFQIREWRWSGDSTPQNTGFIGKSNWKNEDFRKDPLAREEFRIC